MVSIQRQYDCVVLRRLPHQSLGSSRWWTDWATSWITRRSRRTPAPCWYYRVAPYCRKHSVECWIRLHGTSAVKHVTLEVQNMNFFISLSIYSNFHSHLPRAVPIDFHLGSWKCNNRQGNLLPQWYYLQCCMELHWKSYRKYESDKSCVVPSAFRKNDVFSWEHVLLSFLIFMFTAQATTSKDKKIRYIDARSGEVLQEGKGHEGTKASRVVFVGDDDKMFTTGFSRMSERQVCLRSKYRIYGCGVLPYDMPCWRTNRMIFPCDAVCALGQKWFVATKEARDDRSRIRCFVPDVRPRHTNGLCWRQRRW